MKIDYGLALADGLGQGRVTKEALEGFHPELIEAQNWLEAKRRSQEVGFMDLPFQDLSPILQTAQEVRRKFDHFVLIGIGGSSLGAQVLFDALWNPPHNPQVYGEGPSFHILDNVDPVKTTETLEEIEPENTCFCVISKSGSTAEPMANFLVALEALEKAVGIDKARRQMVFITDPEKGNLRDLVKEEGYRALEIPPNVGGRFSVLSPVGLFPAAVLGINVRRLLKGAYQALKSCEKRDISSNPAWVITALHYLHHTLEAKSISVMMAYYEKLATFADWYRQLWAESLGKEGKGQTPVKAVGAVDQHSQIQLYNEGPRDKIITFLQVKNFPTNRRIPPLYPQKPALAYLGGHTLGELINTELAGTASALAKRGVPSMTITLPSVNEGHLGALFMIYEIATALMGHLYGINPFDQPGVEEGKRLTYGLMGRKGFQEKGKEAQEIWSKGKEGTLTIDLGD